MKARKIIIPVSIVAGIAAIGAGVVALGNSASAVAYTSSAVIEQKSLENKISVSGAVESSEVKKVYSKLAAYPIEKVNVKVGDTVKKGDVLCTVDTEELQQQILQQQAVVDSSGVSSDYTLSEAEENYAEALEKYNNGENPSIVSAQRAVEQAKKNLDEAKRQENIGTDSALPSNIHSADVNLKNAKANYDSAVSSRENAVSSYDSAVKAYEKAENAYNEAVSKLDPENYPANVRAVYDKLEEQKGYLHIVQAGLYNSELEDARSEMNNAENEYKTVSEGDSYDKTQVEKYYEAYTAAKQKYETMKNKYDEKNLNDTIKEYETQLKSLIENLEAARDSAESAKDSAENAVTNAEAAVKNADDAVENAKRAYDNAAVDYDNTEDRNDTSKEDYSIAVKNAEDALEQAEKDYDRTVSQVESELSSLKKQAEQQRTVSGLNDSQVIMLQNLKDKLEYAIVTAPCDGVVTAVNAEEGAVPVGALFTIEDIGDLKITSLVGEYDIPYVSEGMTASIRCDALDGAEYDGKVISVAPTAAAAAATASSSGSGANYKIETEVNGEDGKLLVGMNTKVEIISEKRENALTVTYDALTADENGNDAVYIAEKDESGVWHARLVQVKIGLETDYEIEVISDSLSAGMVVLTDTAMISDGAVVNIDETANNEAEQVTE